MNPTQIRATAPDPRHRPEAIAERILPADLQARARRRDQRDRPFRT